MTASQCQRRMTANLTRNAATESLRENEIKEEREIAAGAIGHGAGMLVATAVEGDMMPGDRTGTERGAATETTVTITDVMMITIGEPDLVVVATVVHGITAETEEVDPRGMTMADGAGTGARIVIMSGTDVAVVTLASILQNGDVCVRRAGPGADQEVAPSARTHAPDHGRHLQLPPAVQRETESRRQQHQRRHQQLRYQPRWTQRFWRTSCGKSCFVSVCYSLSRTNAPAPTPALVRTRLNGSESLISFCPEKNHMRFNVACCLELK